jgi:hypothetical protein
VFALNLIRRKLAKNPIDLIRRKFSIDAGCGHRARLRFRNHKPAVLETRHSPFAPNAKSQNARKACEISDVERAACAL